MTDTCDAPYSACARVKHAGWEDGIFVRSDPDMNVACGDHTRRALTAYGNLLNMEEHGRYGCYTVCTNHTLFEVCPPEQTWHHIRNKEYEAGGGIPHVVFHKGHCEKDPRRRLGVTPMSAETFGSYLSDAFKLNQHETIQVVSEKEREEADARHQRARDGISNEQTKKELHDSLWKSLDAAETNECKLPKTVGEEDNAVTRYTDWLCIVKTSIAQPTKATKDTYIKKRKGRELNENEQNFAHSVIDFSEVVKIRFALAKMMLVLPGSISDRVGMLSTHSQATIDLRRRLGHTDFVMSNSYTHMEYKITQGARRLTETMAIESDIRKYHRGRMLADSSATHIGVFAPRHACPANQVRCPDGTTCVLRTKRADCPAPTSSNPFAQIRWGFHLVHITFEGGDIRVWIRGWALCWHTYQVNDKTNPFSISNIGKTKADNPSMTWCFPLIEDFPYRVPRVIWDVGQVVAEQCVGGVCSCPLYSTELWTLDADWIKGIPLFLKARLQNGLLSIQYMFTHFFGLQGSFVDNAWYSVWSWLYLPDWFLRLFGDQGHPGSTGQKNFCSVLHLGSVFYLLFMTLVFIVLWIGAMPFFFYLLFKVILIADAFSTGLCLERTGPAFWACVKCCRKADKKGRKGL